MVCKILNTIDRIIGYIVVFLFALSVVVLFYQVVLRYAFSASNIWAEELSTFSIVWMCSLGCALAFRRYKHITITTISDMIPWKIRRYIDIASYLLIIVFLAYAFFSSFPLIKAQWNVYTTGFRVRQGFLYTCIPVSAVFMVISIMECICDKIKNFNVEPGKVVAKDGD
jgi:TRAP-type C4-dicarboxylate transport system permease small subunit